MSTSEVILQHFVGAESHAVRQVVRALIWGPYDLSNLIFQVSDVGRGLGLRDWRLLLEAITVAVHLKCGQGGRAPVRRSEPNTEDHLSNGRWPPKPSEIGYAYRTQAQRQRYRSSC